MQLLEPIDAYISVHCDRQLYWIKPSGPALSWTMSPASEETSVSPATGSSGQVCQKTDICLQHLLARAWLLSCNANGCTWGTPPRKWNPRKIPMHPVTAATTRTANTNSWPKQTLKYLPSSTEVQLSFFFTLCALPLQFSPLLVKDTFYEVKLLE